MFSDREISKIPDIDNYNHYNADDAFILCMSLFFYQAMFYNCITKKQLFCKNDNIQGAPERIPMLSQGLVSNTKYCPKESF